MYVLPFLSDSLPRKSDDDVVAFEYRLLCSGEVYNKSILTGDWRKTDITRLLLTAPFALVVCSHPFDDYPQELSLRFRCPLVTEAHGRTTTTFYPDDEIANDLAALLTLLLRRLTTVTAKIREQHPRRYASEPEELLDLPVDFVNNLAPSHWDREPSSIVYGREGILELTDYNPPPLGVDPLSLSALLRGLASSPHAQAFVLSARLYTLALEQIKHDADLAYQLLVSSVEAIATEVLRAYLPERDEMVEAKKSVFDLAVKLGLERERAESIAIEACSGIAWTSRKFVKFLVDNVGPEIWEPDDLFHPPDFLLPNRHEFAHTLRSIYAARGSAAHSGHPYPGGVQFGIGPTVSTRALIDLDFASPDLPVPPVVWFERVANSAIRGLIQASATAHRSGQSPEPG